MWGILIMRGIICCLGVDDFIFPLWDLVMHPDDSNEVIVKFDEVMYNGLENITGNHKLTDI